MSGTAKRKPVFDLLLIGGLLLLALVCYLLFAGGRSEGNVALVCVNGVETDRYPLFQNGRYPLNGGSNILIIEDGFAWLEDADCPKSFEGFPLALISAGLLALAFMGFSGLHF